MDREGLPRRQHHHRPRHRHPRRRNPAAGHLRPGRSPGGAGDPHHQRPVLGSSVAGAGVLRNPAHRRRRPRLRQARAVRRGRGSVPPRPRRDRQGGSALRTHWLGTGEQGQGHRGRDRLRRAPVQGRDRGFPVHPGASGRDPALAGPAGPTARRHRGRHPGRRGQARRGAAAAGRRGRHRSSGASPRNRPAVAVDDGPGTQGAAAGAAEAATRPQHPRGAREGAAAGDLHHPSESPGTPRETVGRSRPVRGLRDRDRPPRTRGGLRVHRQGGGRRRAAPVHRVGGQGNPVPDGQGHPVRFPDGGLRRHPLRRQGPLRRLLRHGLPNRGRPGAARGRDGEQHRCAGTGRPGADHRRGGLPGTGPDGPGGSPRAGARQRRRHRAPRHHRRAGAAAGADQLPHRPARPGAGHGQLHPGVQQL